MTPQKVEEIYKEVIKEKTSVDISENKEELHNGIDPRVANFLARYENDPKSCVDKLQGLNDKAQQLLQKVKLD